MEEKKTYFITMKAKPETTLFNWQHQVEELRTIIGANVPVIDWGSLRVYGPGDGSWDLPAVCIQTWISAEVMEQIALDVTNNYWIELSVVFYELKNVAAMA